MDSLNRTLATAFLFCSLAASAQLTLEESTLESYESMPVTDVTAPSTDLLRTDVREFIYGPTTRIKFKIVEDESGIESTYFKIANLPYMKSDGRQMVPHQLEDGAYSIKYYSVDNSGNQEQVRIDKIYIDKNGPKISTHFGMNPIAVENGLPVFSGDVQLDVKAEDAQVEVQKLTYKINDGPIVKSENTTSISLTEILKDTDEENITIEIRAYDSFYNLSKEVVEFSIKN